MSPQWFQTLKDVRRTEAAQEAWESLVVEEREVKIRMAKVLEAIHAAKHYCVKGCASIGEYVEKYGYSAQYGRDLVGTGKLMKRSARVERLLRESRLSIQAAGVIERVMGEVPEAKLDEWLDLAVKTSTRALIQLAMEALETARMGGGPLKTRTLRLSPTGDREFEHAKAIARRRADMPLNDSEANERFVRCYIDRYDPHWRDLGKHRVRGIRSAVNPKSRWIPAEVKREVRLRDGDKCSVPFCDHQAWIAYAHAIVPFADGGTNGRTNIFLLCHFHNWMMVDGYLKVGGTADDPIFMDEDGLPYVPLGWTREQMERRMEEHLSAPRPTFEEILEIDRRLAEDDPTYKDKPG